MAAAPAVFTTENAWWAFGMLAATVFYGRFYVQWIVSEIKKQSVIPLAFWYMSSVGALMLFSYAVYIRNPGAAFGLCFNIVVYARNLVHIWRERGKLTRTINVTVNAVAGCIAATAIVFMALTWFREYQANEQLPAAEAARNWFWVGVWGVGQALFFSRFAIQWLMTEIKKRSVVPPVFWYCSLAAAILQSAAFSQRQDWVNTIGMGATIFIYARNIWFIHRGAAPEKTEAAGT